MKGFLTLLLILWPGFAAAQVIALQSGEHDSFSRLVIESPDLSGWQVYRTEVGYAVNLPGAPRLDLSKVYDRIGHQRIAAIWADPQTGWLQLRIGCNCHALPYDFRPGVLVLDIRDGPAPEGSSFELALDGRVLKPFAAPDPDRPRPRPENKGLAPSFDWVAEALADAPTETGLAWPLTVSDPNLVAVRDGLFRELGSGAARGVVTLALPPPKFTTQADQSGMAQLRIGEDLGMITLPGGREGARGALAMDGQTCPTAEQLDLAGWGSDEPVAQALVTARQGLLGEFDKPDPAALDRAVRFHLYLGFGAEARQYLEMHAAPPADLVMLQALGYVIDQQPDPMGFFRAFASCDTPAALWAALDAPLIGDLSDLNGGAVVRAFATLPPHLRRALGPVLAGKYLDIGQVEQARMVTAAILRGADAPDAATKLAVAHVDLASGDEKAAETVIVAVAQDNTPVSPQAMIDLVALRLGQGQAVDAGQIDLLAALAQEHRETKLGLDLRRALALAQATAGHFDAAFAEAESLHEDLPDLWRLLAAQGASADLLTHAVRPAAALVPEISWGLRRQLAVRLQELGLPEPALWWLQPSALADPAADETRALRAALYSARFDYEGALDLLAGAQDVQAGPLRAEALLQLEQTKAAASQYAAMGDADGLARARRRAGDWVNLPVVDGPWSAATALASLPAATGPGPLARGQALLEESAAARAQIDALLELTPWADNQAVRSGG